MRIEYVLDLCFLLVVVSSEWRVIIYKNSLSRARFFLFMFHLFSLNVVSRAHLLYIFRYLSIIDI